MKRGRAWANHRACPGGCGELDDECACRRRRATLCGPSGAVRPEDLTDDDRAALDGFAHLLRGGSGCLICMTPDDHCHFVYTRGIRPEKCCPDCKHGRIPTRPTEGATT